MEPLTRDPVGTLDETSAWERIGKEALMAKKRSRKNIAIRRRPSCDAAKAATRRDVLWVDPGFEGVVAHLRLPVVARHTLGATAALRGETFPTFVRRLLIEKAREIRRQSPPTRLSPRAFTQLLDLVDDDREPTPAVKRALRKWRRQARPETRI